MPADRLRLRRALLSVSDKTGLLELARTLAGLGVELLSTGGTARALREAGLAVRDVSELTGFPEIMDGRVKTLHPKVHGALLGRSGTDDAVMAEHGIAPIDLLVLNLYPFEATVAQPGCTLDAAIETIDIGGPAMLRAAAKNFARVAVATDPGQYPALLRELAGSDGALSAQTRFALAVAAFNRVARYDAAIGNYLSALGADGSVSAFPSELHGSFVKLADLRYGENPHQQAAFYRDLWPAPGSLATLVQRQGKELSYNNLADADAAWDCVRQFQQPACVIVKHANPCGVCEAGTLEQAYQRAFATDPTSAFGGIIAFNRPLDGATATALAARFVEVVIAPAFDAAALAALAKKPNLRAIEIPSNAAEPRLAAHAGSAWAAGRNAMDSKRVGSGLLLQTADNQDVTEAGLTTVTRRQPTAAELADLLFAWRVARYVKSNAIVYARDGATVGVGAGQMSRVVSAKIAGLKAAEAGLAVPGAVMASDAFFPFRDGIDAAAEAGIAAVIQPGGSMRDAEVIAAADAHGMAMVFTGVRHFRH